MASKNIFSAFKKIVKTKQSKLHSEDCMLFYPSYYQQQQTKKSPTVNSCLSHN